MSLPATALRFWGLALTAWALQSCGGKVIVLGDGPAAAGSGGAGGMITGITSAGSTSAGSASAGSSGAGGAGVGGAAGRSACTPSGVLASEVLWIGDSWVQSPGTQRDYVRDQARLAQTLGMTEDYDSVAVAAAYMDDVAQQYAEREVTDPLKVILMDGGTWDPIAAQMGGANVDDAMDGSIARFQQFLADVAADGSVEHIVYFLPPPLPLIPSEPMQPRLLDACAQSEVHCHFLDLKDVWENHPEYTQMGIQASPAGGTEIGKRIWEIMQTECIAQ